MDLREQCLETDGGGNTAFWKEVCAVGRTLSLISKTEAVSAGGRSRISESVASEVGYKRAYVRLLLIKKAVTVRCNQVMYLKLNVLSPVTELRHRHLELVEFVCDVTFVLD